MNRRRALLTIIASTEEVVDTYSAAMRGLRDDPEKRMIFMKKFKEVFDNALSRGMENHQDVALVEAKKIAAQNPRLVKLAKMALGTSNNPNEVGKTVAEIIKVILGRVPQDKSTIYNTMKNKILNLNVSEISGTTLPDTATYGQSLTLIKTLLSGYDPEFVRQVLVSTSNYLY